MTRNQLEQAFTIAKNQNIDLSHVDDTNLFGCGLSTFDTVYTTLEAVAKLIRWQALQFNGQWNADALDELAKIGKTKFKILG